MVVKAVVMSRRLRTTLALSAILGHHVFYLKTLQHHSYYFHNRLLVVVEA